MQVWYVMSEYISLRESIYKVQWRKNKFWCEMHICTFDLFSYIQVCLSYKHETYFDLQFNNAALWLWSIRLSFFFPLFFCSYNFFAQKCLQRGKKEKATIRLRPDLPLLLFAFFAFASRTLVFEIFCNICSMLGAQFPAEIHCLSETSRKTSWERYCRKAHYEEKWP